MSIVGTLSHLVKGRKIYISGPIKDTPDHLKRFAAGAQWIDGMGFTAVNPCCLEHEADATYEDFMREDIRALLDCQGVYMLKGWEKSAGARAEHLVAVMIGLPIAYE